MISGFYRITFTGAAGSGFGILVFKDGFVSGADVAGAIFDGTYREDPGGQKVDFETSMTLPAGVAPVQTGISLAAPMTDIISGSLLVEDIGTDNPTRLEMTSGPVNVLFKKIRDL